MHSCETRALDKEIALEWETGLSEGEMFLNEYIYI
jgi:hypothetical protein